MGNLPFTSAEGMIQATTKLSIKKGKFDEVNQILVEELDAMKSFEGLYDLSVTKVDDQTLMIVATYFSTVELEQNGENIKSGLGKIGPFLAKNPERNIGDVILTKGTYAKPDLSQWEEPGEF